MTQEEKKEYEVIVNEEFAKLAVPITPEVTAVKNAILARLN